MALDFNWTTVLVGILNVLVGGLLVAMVKTRPALRKIAVDREANLLSERAEEMEEMRGRITKLEGALAQRESDHAKEIKAIEGQQAIKDKIAEAQKAADRHRMNNLNQAFTALLMLLKKGVPVEEAVSEVEAMRAEQLQREAEDAMAIHAMAIKAGIEPDDAK